MDSYSTQIQTTAAILEGTVSLGVILCTVATILRRLNRAAVSQRADLGFDLNEWIESLKKSKIKDTT